jgi:hypothetical protein
MQAENFSIALVIPYRDDQTNLNDLLHSIAEWTKQADEIIIIDSSQIPTTIPNDFINFCSTSGIAIVHKQFDKLIFPGHARNIGISASRSNLIAFLDVKTIPSIDWLEKNFKLMRDNSADGVWGKTIYECTQNKQRIIRAATYGKSPVKTLPGSLIKKDCFFKAGLFIETVRAGEDGDWFNRAFLHQLNILDHNNVGFLKYKLLQDITYKNIVLKWYRNNSFASPLPYLKPHKDIYFYLASILSVLIAFNWNNIFADWDLDSTLYIPNITKITASLVFICYYIVRGFFIPLRKGLRIKDLIPISHLQVFTLSSILDLVKIFAFFNSALHSFFKSLKI